MLLAGTLYQNYKLLKWEEIYKIILLYFKNYMELWCTEIFSSDNKVLNEQQIFHIGKNESSDVLWSDIPNVSNNLNSKDKLANLVRFAFAYNYMYSPPLTGNWNKIKKFSNENWFKRLVFKHTYDYEQKECQVGQENYQEIISLMKDYSEDVLTWIVDMQNSTTLKTDQKMNLVLSDFFSDFTAKNASNRVKLKEKLNAKEKDQFKDLVTDNNNFRLLNVMSNVCYEKIKKIKKD